MLNGFVSGALATACMSGVAAARRRLLHPTGPPPGPRHYELVAQRMAELVGDEGTVLDDATRVRLGKGLHSLFGGVMGVAFICVVERTSIPAPLRGTVHGLALWALAFAGYFPAMRIQEGMWIWDREEVGRTLRAHLAYGNSVMLMTRGWQRRK